MTNMSTPYFDLGKILTDEQVNEYTNTLLDFRSSGEGRFEGDNQIYGNSYGGFPITFEWDVLHSLTPTIKSLVVEKIKPANPYSRIYYNGALLKPHIDRPTLDWTLTIGLGNNLKTDWPFYIKLDDGEIMKFPNLPGFGYLIQGTKTLHWREPLVCQEYEYSAHLFCHWEVVNKSGENQPLLRIKPQ